VSDASVWEATAQLEIGPDGRTALSLAPFEVCVLAPA